MLDQFTANRKIPLAVFLLAVIPFALTGCGDLTIEGDPLAFLAPGPPNSDRPGEDPSVTSAAVPADPLATLQPFQPAPGGMMGTMGLNLETYLAPEIEDPVERIERLERTIIAMHKDMQAMAPALQKAAPAERQSLNAQAIESGAPLPLQPPEDLEIIASGGPEPLHRADMQPVISPPPPAPPPVTPPVTSSSTTGIRVGEHPDKVRLVIDVAKGTNFSADLDNIENILVIELPETAWTGPTHENFKSMPVMKSYKVDAFNSGAGSMIVIQLNKSTTLLSQSKMPALSGSGERIVIDLQK